MIATETGPKTLTYAEYRARKTRRTVTHPVVTDDDALVAYRAADAALTAGRGRVTKEQLDALQAERTTAEQAVRTSTLLMRLQALPREGERSFDVLKAEHPPQDVDHEQARDNAAARGLAGAEKAKARWHTATFAPALLAACLIEPVVDVHQATELLADLNDGEWDALVGAAIAVNTYATDTGGLVFS